MVTTSPAATAKDFFAEDIAALFAFTTSSTAQPQAEKLLGIGVFLTSAPSVQILYAEVWPLQHPATKLKEDEACVLAAAIAALPPLL